MGEKKNIVSIAEKNRVINRIIDAFDEKDGFLLNGHKNPDEDCISSMVALGLLLSKFEKKVFVVACSEIQDNYRYLLNICRHNSITIINSCHDIPAESLEAIVVLDTPKPSMLMGDGVFRQLLNNHDVLKIEFDHHLEADSVYAGDEGYRLVAEASSTCELIGLLALKLRNRSDIITKYQIENLFARNFVLAVLTGIIGDSKMGKYLKSNRERWFYRLFSNMFETMLEKKTFKGSGNFSNMEEVYDELVSLSKEEEECYRFMVQHEKSSGHIRHVVLSKKDSFSLGEKFSPETIVNIARTVADRLAEKSGYISLVSYYDTSDESKLIQFRMRRSQSYTDLDLRSVVSLFNIENGGGHEGAIGFRIEQDSVPDLFSFTDRIIEGTEKLMRQ